MTQSAKPTIVREMMARFLGSATVFRLFQKRKMVSGAIRAIYSGRARYSAPVINPSRKAKANTLRPPLSHVMYLVKQKKSTTDKNAANGCAIGRTFLHITVAFTARKNVAMEAMGRSAKKRMAS